MFRIPPHYHVYSCILSSMYYRSLHNQSNGLAFKLHSNLDTYGIHFSDTYIKLTTETSFLKRICPKFWDS